MRTPAKLIRFYLLLIITIFNLKYLLVTITTISGSNQFTVTTSISKKLELALINAATATSIIISYNSIDATLTII